MSDDNDSLFGVGLVIVLVAAILIAVLASKGVLQFHWVYVTAAKRFWSVFFTLWLWDVYFYVVYLIFFIIGKIKN